MLSKRQKNISLLTLGGVIGGLALYKLGTLFFNFNKEHPLHLKTKKGFTSDKGGHYDIDGVSISGDDGVVVATDNSASQH